MDDPNFVFDKYRKEYLKNQRDDVHVKLMTVEEMMEDYKYRQSLRLNAWKDSLYQHCKALSIDGLINEWAKDKAEVEKLEEHNKYLMAHIDNERKETHTYYGRYVAVSKENQLLRRKIDRLRDLLKES